MVGTTVRVSDLTAGRLVDPQAGIVIVGFVFAGGCGTNNARRFMASVAPQDYPELFILVLNTDGPQLRGFFDPASPNADLNEKERENLRKWIATTGESQKLTIIQLGETGSGAGGDPEVGRAAAEAKRDQIQEWMQPLHAVVIAGGAGKGTGGGALPVLQSIASELGKSPLTVVTMPFAHEGGGRTRKAQETLDTLYGQAPTIAIRNENVPEELSKNKGFRELYDEINKSSIQMVFRGITEITQVVGDTQNVDIADWRKVLSLGNRVTCNWAKFDNTFTTFGSGSGGEMEAFIDRLFQQDPYQDKSSRLNAVGMLVWAHGTWCPDELRSVILAASEDPSRGFGDRLEVFSGIHVGNDGAKWIMTLSVAEEPEAAKLPDDSEKEELRAQPAPSPIALCTGNSSTKPAVEVRTIIHLPNEGKSEPASAKVTPDLAERWNRLFPRNYLGLLPAERREYDKLVDLIHEQTGILVRPVPRGLLCPANR